MKKWLINRFLPMWAKEIVLTENLALRKEVARLEQENGRLRSYIDGIKFAAKKCGYELEICGDEMDYI